MRRMHTLVIALLAVCLVRGTHAAPAEAPKPDGPEVRVLESGAAPLRLLRFTPKQGESTLLRQRQKLDITMTLGGMPLARQDMPTMVFDTELTLTNADAANDRFTGEFHLVDSAVENDGGIIPAQRDMIADLLDSIEISGTIEFDSLGRVHGSTLVPGANVPAEMAQVVGNLGDNMKQLVAPLPPTPVGIGARWEVVATMTMNGVEMVNRTVHTVERIDGDRVHTSIAMTVEAVPNQTLPVPDPTVQATLLSSKGTGVGEAVFDLANPLFSDHTARITTEQVIEMTMLGETQQMNQTIEVDTSIKSVEP